MLLCKRTMLSCSDYQNGGYTSESLHQWDDVSHPHLGYHHYPHHHHHHYQNYQITGNDKNDLFTSYATSSNPVGGATENHSALVPKFPPCAVAAFATANIHQTIPQPPSSHLLNIRIHNREIERQHQQIHSSRQQPLHQQQHHQQHDHQCHAIVNSSLASCHVIREPCKGQLTLGEVMFGGGVVSRVGSHQTSCVNEKQRGAGGPLPQLDVGPRFTTCQLDIASHKLAEPDSSGECFQALGSTSPRPEPLANSKAERIGLKATTAHNARAKTRRPPLTGAAEDNASRVRSSQRGVSCSNSAMGEIACTDSRTGITAYNKNVRTSNADQYLEQIDDDKGEVRNDDDDCLADSCKRTEDDLSTKRTFMISNKEDKSTKVLLRRPDIISSLENGKLVQARDHYVSIQSKALMAITEGTVDAEINKATTDVGHCGTGITGGSCESSSLSSVEEDGEVSVKEEEDKSASLIYPWMRSQYGKTRFKNTNKNKPCLYFSFVV